MIDLAKKETSFRLEGNRQYKFCIVVSEVSIYRFERKSCNFIKLLEITFKGKKKNKIEKIKKNIKFCNVQVELYNLLFVKPEPVQCTVAVYCMQYSTEFSSMDNKVLAARLE